MAKIDDIKIRLLIGERSEMRPCWVKNGGAERKALFHCWEQKSQLVGASAMLGGHPSGMVLGMVALVEYEDGTVHEVYPSGVRFLDTDAIMSQYAWLMDQGEDEDEHV